MSEPIKLPEALRLADVPICQRSLEWQSNATAELRRLHAEVRDADWAYDSAAKRADKMQQERDEARKDRDDVLASYADACKQLLEAEKAGDEARAEVERLRADAERWRYFVTHCQWFRHHDEDGSYSTMSTRLPYDADQSCVATRNAAIDAALKVPK